MKQATVARTVGILGLQWQPEHAALVHLLARQYHLPHLMLTDKPESGGSRLGVQVAPSTDQRYRDFISWNAGRATSYSLFVEQFYQCTRQKNTG